MRKMNYKEYIYKVCKDTNFGNEEEAIQTAQFLAGEAIRYFRFLELQDEYMKLNFTYKEVNDMAKTVAQQVFSEDVDALPEGGFKDCCRRHMDEILRV